MLLGGEALQDVATATSVAVRDGGGSSPTGRSRRPRSSSPGTTWSSAADLDDAIEAAARIPGAQARHRRGPADPGARLSGPTAEARPTPDDAVADAPFREDYGRALATLIRVLGDFDLAEEAVADAYLVALEHWPVDGVPDNPGAWITTTARNRAIDRVRRARRFADKAAAHRARCGRRCRPSGHGDAHGGGGRDAADPRRPAATDLHVLPPGARAGVGGRADPAHARRPDDARDRPGLPRARADARPAAGPGQEEDPRGRHPRTRSRPETASPTGSTRCCGSSTSCSTRATTPRRARR